MFICRDCRDHNGLMSFTLSWGTCEVCNRPDRSCGDIPSGAINKILTPAPWVTPEELRVPEDPEDPNDILFAGESDHLFVLARERRLILETPGRPGLHENSRDMARLGLKLPSEVRLLVILKLMRMLERACHELNQERKKGKK